MIVSAQDANRRFSEILKAATEGKTVTITKHGEPVATMVRYEDPTVRERRAAAQARLVALMRQGGHLGGDDFDRDSLYER